ncbi:hypothetical protein K438DRAFT_1977206 [Mycena galopus ATCC 62051]|nr:hypothetical protein K438DRAFT_1977206 [Mycena galopus ATCC 62051]
MLISTYTIKHSSTVSTALFYAIGPLYVLTLIYNLNLRPYDDVGASDTGTGGSLMRPSLMRPPLTHPSFTNPSCTVDICMDTSSICECALHNNGIDRTTWRKRTLKSEYAFQLIPPVYAG